MMHLYERWLWLTQRDVFEEASKWCIDNSLRVGDFLSAGCCNICDQFDSPGAIMLCEIDECPLAMHCFCNSPVYTIDDMPDKWYCAMHS